jgi:hypothetical protein
MLDACTDANNDLKTGRSPCRNKAMTCLLPHVDGKLQVSKIGVHESAVERGHD